MTLYMKLNQKRWFVGDHGQSITGTIYTDKTRTTEFKVPAEATLSVSLFSEDTNYFTKEVIHSEEGTNGFVYIVGRGDFRYPGTFYLGLSIQNSEGIQSVEPVEFHVHSAGRLDY